MRRKANSNTYKCRAQSVFEYAMVVACLVAALIGMQIYIKRSVQGRLKSAADDTGEQYSALRTRSSLTQTITSTANITGIPNFVSVNAGSSNEMREIIEVNRTENMTINLGAGSFEETGGLSSETLFP
ncbi:MAG: hypothetical protein HY350_02740 [Candidatus Omnitrophica bacterium]|nr:hypothetical protein [Candidatus Omnitrophota bacterium]